MLVTIFSYNLTPFAYAAAGPALAGSSFGMTNHSDANQSYLETADALCAKPVNSYDALEALEHQFLKTSLPERALQHKQVVHTWMTAQAVLQTMSELSGFPNLSKTLMPKQRAVESDDDTFVENAPTHPIISKTFAKYFAEKKEEKNGDLSLRDLIEMINRFSQGEEIVPCFVRYQGIISFFLSAEGRPYPLAAQAILHSFKTVVTRIPENRLSGKELRVLRNIKAIFVRDLNLMFEELLRRQNTRTTSTATVLEDRQVVSNNGPIARTRFGIDTDGNYTGTFHVQTRLQRRSEHFPLILWVNDDSGSMNSPMIRGTREQRTKYDLLIESIGRLTQTLNQKLKTDKVAEEVADLLSQAIRLHFSSTARLNPRTPEFGVTNFSSILAVGQQLTAVLGTLFTELAKYGVEPKHVQPLVIIASDGEIDDRDPQAVKRVKLFLEDVLSFRTGCKVPHFASIGVGEGYKDDNLKAMASSLQDVLPASTDFGGAMTRANVLLQNPPQEIEQLAIESFVNGRFMVLKDIDNGKYRPLLLEFLAGLLLPSENPNGQFVTLNHASIQPGDFEMLVKGSVFGLKGISSSETKPIAEVRVHVAALPGQVEQVMDNRGSVTVAPRTYDMAAVAVSPHSPLPFGGSGYATNSLPATGGSAYRPLHANSSASPSASLGRLVADCGAHALLGLQTDGPSSSSRRQADSASSVLLGSQCYDYDFDAPSTSVAAAAAAVTHTTASSAVTEKCGSFIELYRRLFLTTATPELLAEPCDTILLAPVQKAIARPLMEKIVAFVSNNPDDDIDLRSLLSALAVGEHKDAIQMILDGNLRQSLVLYKALISLPSRDFQTWNSVLAS